MFCKLILFFLNYILESNCPIEQLRILLRSRYNEYVINEFTYDEITELIREITCH